MLTGDQLAVLNQGLGKRIRLARKARRWRIRHLHHAIFYGDPLYQHHSEPAPGDIPGVQVVGMYERGNRPMSLGRFVQVCVALEVPAWEVLRDVLESELAISVPAGGSEVVTVDLRKLSCSTHPRLEPLKRWLESERHRLTSDSPLVELDAPALRALAVLTRTSVEQLVVWLSDLRHVPSWTGRVEAP